ncbi:relaxase/mobilization nuclease domain-containing protein [Amycolatopsis minnesotensis]|uniref:MobA/VirD2-like nuclease domain-containing protein n=1 Tax=Amycolatopsis minnesotensis TaxID=337894 RepID=A0ABN2SAZ8_9PSEU
MIRKVLRSSNMARTVHYLFGPGRNNEHTDPHLVAAWDPAWLDDPALVASLATARGRVKLIAAVEEPRVLHQVEVPGGHVYHVPLSLPAADGELGDARWRQVVEEAIAKLGFGSDAGGRGGCRWIAVHHGRNTSGNDHIHVVVQLVRGDGRIATLWRDWPKWDAVCQAAEERWDLTRTRRAGAGQPGLARAEVERAAHTGREPQRRELARRVRAVAAGTGSEPAFLTAVRDEGIRVEPRVTGGRVTGYRVALEGPGGPLVWFSGGRLHRDLSLPRLRARWAPQSGSDEAMVAAWRGEFAVPAPELLREREWRSARRKLTTVVDHVEDLARVDGADDAGAQVWPELAVPVADLATVLATRLEPDGGSLTDAGAHLARAAQHDPDRTRRHHPRHRPPTRASETAALIRDVARVLAYSPRPGTTVAVVAVLLAVLVLMRLLARLAARHTDPAAHRQWRLGVARFAEQPDLARARAQPSPAPVASTPVPGVAASPAPARHRLTWQQPTRAVARPPTERSPGRRTP